MPIIVDQNDAPGEITSFRVAAEVSSGRTPSLVVKLAPYIRAAVISVCMRAALRNFRYQ